MQRGADAVFRTGNRGGDGRSDEAETLDDDDAASALTVRVSRRCDLAELDAGFRQGRDRVDVSVRGN